MTPGKAELGGFPEISWAKPNTAGMVHGTTYLEIWMINCGVPPMTYRKPPSGEV